jgi:hypothetical protein
MRVVRVPEMSIIFYCLCALQRLGSCRRAPVAPLLSLDFLDCFRAKELVCALLPRLDGSKLVAVGGERAPHWCRRSGCHLANVDRHDCCTLVVAAPVLNAPTRGIRERVQTVVTRS